MLHFVTSYMKQNKDVNELESAHNGLEITFNLFVEQQAVMVEYQSCSYINLTFAVAKLVILIELFNYPDVAAYVAQ